MQKSKLFAGLALVASLAACGDNPTEQALYGGSAGLLGSLVLDGNPVVGAAAGAAGNMLYCKVQGTCN
ncbi:hypothetical protein KQ247_14240 [Ruegeria pomeroyi]|jgi:hypothetical protein|uniref:Lipoprotein, putative n=2 Tax=Ruegeria pomeroyi TaxID=89184 RepID=Q5LUF4_RUEPO|nr:hypothetical protein [Ruegeria pomeroyi]HCE71413.1 hypothetical protein [Ruegeria sp.]AAV94400.1 lipoprotein, putative [Ruegeria pomeroyi DSS-3]NVK97252.1 hypothetical protein [Ruegeria pomeroyi]NVL02806.1 hypothetical protein [Ruegeria pomeroyi]QWV07982.1 hypothetical protein KQ247_14240 [Ruegeria pomeroyi]